MPLHNDDTIFKQPLEDFEFDSLTFAKPAFVKAEMLCTQNPQQSLKVNLAHDNNARLDKLHLDVNQTDSSDLKSLASCIEPFDLVKVDLEQTKMFAIENILQTSYEKLREASHYNLLLKGKNFRSAILFLLAKAIYYSQNSAAGKDLLPFEKTEMYDKVTCLAACIEIAHNASLLQDDIIDHADNRRGRQAAHKVFGAANSVFASDFMIARAGRMLTEVFSDSTHISQIYSTVLTNLVFGELIQAKRDMVNQQAALEALNATRDRVSQATSEHERLLHLLAPYDYKTYFESYVAKTYYKTASMISLGCRGIAVIMDFHDIEQQRQLFDFGANLGIAFQIHDDILDFTQSEAQLGKPAFNDLKEGIVTAPIIYALLEQQAADLRRIESTTAVTENELLSIAWSEALHRKFQGKTDIDIGKQMLDKRAGIELADSLSIDYIDRALVNLSGGGEFGFGGRISNSKEVNLRALVGLALKVKTRNH